MSEKSVLHLATTDLLRECARQTRRMILHSKMSIWVYGGTEGSDLHVTAAEISGHDDKLIGVYNEHASVESIAEDFIHYARSIGVQFMGVA